jgi:hypothetical protein
MEILLVRKWTFSAAAEFVEVQSAVLLLARQVMHGGFFGAGIRAIADAFADLFVATGRQLRFREDAIDARDFSADDGRNQLCKCGRGENW